MPLTTYTIHEGPGLEIVAEVRYTIQPACGDGWNEPREPRHVELGVANIVKRTASYRRVDLPNGRTEWPTVWLETHMGRAPEWVDDILENDTDWQAELLAEYDDGPDPDRAYDEARDLELQNR